MDPSGEWGPRFDEDRFERIPGPEIGDYLGLPINDAARLRGDSWDAALIELPENQCRAHGSDYGWRGPSNLSIWKEVDQATQKVIAYHTHLSAYGAEQTIWMDGRPHPPDYARHTWQGFSTGEWDGDTLVITTTHLKENWIRRNGIPRSDLATARVHIMKHGNYLTVAVIVYDPVYLTEPFIRTTDFVYAPQQQMAPWPCEPVDEVDRPPGVVPHHLPGTNTFLNEFPANYGIPVAGDARRCRDDVPGVHAENEDHGGAAATREEGGDAMKRSLATILCAGRGSGGSQHAAWSAARRLPAGPAPLPKCISCRSRATSPCWSAPAATSPSRPAAMACCWWTPDLRR